MKTVKLAVVGATGMVGRTFLKVLEEYRLPVSEYVLFASARSAGTEVDFMGARYTIRELTENSFDEGFDVALFSAGGSISAKFAPIAAAKGCVVVDNSSQWRMEPGVPLVVPEVNPGALKNHKNIIANPNCSTTQAMLPLKAISDVWGLERVVYATYQGVSGAGLAGWTDLAEGAKAYVNGTEYKPEKFPYPIFGNCIPHIDVFTENGYTKEEMKMVNETKKIFGDRNIKVSATCVRVPVFYGHSEAVWIETARHIEPGAARELMSRAPGILVVDEPAEGKYPMAIDAAGRDEVFVGRIRADISTDNGLTMWIVSDNLRKGAATNAVEIAELLIRDPELLKTSWEW